MAERPRLSDDDVIHSFQSIFSHPEAARALAYLQSVVEEIGPLETCALHAHNARRTFASELIALAVIERSESDSDGSGDETTRYGRESIHRRRNRRHGPVG